MIEDIKQFQNSNPDGSQGWPEDGSEWYSARILEELKGELFVLGDTDNSDLLVYDAKSGLFKLGERIVKRRAKALLGAKIRIAQIKEVLNLVHLEAPRKSASEFDRDRNLITFSNGVLDVRGEKLLPFSPENLCRIRIPNQYDPEATCPTIDRFLGEVASGEYHPLIEELLGCGLTGDVRFEKCLLILGPGSSGKSVFLKLAQAMVGSENTVSVPLKELVDRHYYRAELYNKRLNAFADIDDLSPRSLGILKALISGDQIQAERKYKDPFSFTNSAVMIFSCNRLPLFRQNDYAVRRRFIVIPFPNRLQEEDTDIDLISKLTTSQELSGLINRATAGYRRLLENGRFSVPEESERVLEVHFKHLDSAALFLRERTLEDPSARTAKTVLYSAYERYCLNRPGDLSTGFGVRLLSRNKFNKELRRLRSSVKEGKMGSSDRRDAWIGIGLREEGAHRTQADPKVAGSRDSVH